ncbi:AraC family transcriptional regulator [Myceligenerans pegani]|uniref:AraC family transcriptional regulator n=1 Tax=Myceligenerans pegani TaxID=2776917 RepID=A0ABR9N5Q3_9MICO|nr:AraC family transcriptional regulator [Myceligenerans sp. TRM 65318]MBE1878997.1 AraC family transcriptional regulator [Myceligenerans sp. TRM 65318]MBE3021268.1 AraC family transcriptional regulator [Myceligenerans sp. TRM 65318]
MVVLEAEHADSWETLVSECFVPLRCARFEPAFSGRMEHTPLDDSLSVSLATSSGHCSERTERLAARAAGDDLHISLQRSSTGTVSQGGRSASVRPGSVVVYATDRPYYVDYSRPGQQQLLVQVSRSSLGLPERMVEAATDRLAVPGGQQEAAVHNLFSYVATLPDGAGPPLVADVTRDLARVMVRTSFGDGPVVPRTSGGLRHTIREFLRAHATMPGLDIDHVARSHFVSRRRLYQVFEQVGLTPAAFLRSERLRVAARLLTDASVAARTVEQVAYASGFDDVGTFTRAFRREHGCTPREWRARERAVRAS